MCEIWCILLHSTVIGAPFLAALSPWQRFPLSWFGYDFSPAASGENTELVWTNLPESWGLLLLIAVVTTALYGVFALYSREASTCPRWTRRVLASLRAAVVLLLAAIFLGPSVVYLQTRTLQPTIVLARDASLSMLTADQYA